VVETVVAKALETEAVVWRRRKQWECLCGGCVGSSQWNQRGSGDGVKKSNGGGGGSGGRNVDNGFGGS
jgi:hypothetical protein